MHTPPHSRPDTAAPVQRVVHYFETLTLESLAALASVYTEDAAFKDPFHTVQGLPAIRRIFEHMFRRLDAPRFQVHECLGDARHAFLTWEFAFRFRGEARERCIHGCTHLRFASDGRVCMHRDYWDAAEEFYAQLPVLAPLMRWLRRRAAAVD